MTVSVALAAYNGERFIRQQIASILDQTVPVTELVVSDDNSTDGTVGVVEDMAAHDSRVRILKNSENAGFVGNFERALRQCSGQYIALADQDDVWEPDKIEVQLRAIGSKGMVCSDASLIDEKGLQVHRSFREYGDLIIGSADPLSLLVNWFVTGCTVMVRADVVARSLPLPAGIAYHDFWLAVVASHMGGIEYVWRPLVRYRQHRGNQIGARNSNLWGIVRKWFTLTAFEESTSYWRMRQDMFLAVLHTERIQLSGSEKELLHDAVAYYGVFVGDAQRVFRFDLLARHLRLFAPTPSRFVREIGRYAAAVWYRIVRAIHVLDGKGWTCA